MDDAPGPRILFEAVPSIELFEELRVQAGTSAVVQSSDDIHPSDWDLLVTWSSAPVRRSGRFHVLSFGGTDLARLNGRALTRGGRSFARTAYVADGVSRELSVLLERTVVMAAPSTRPLSFLRVGVPPQSVADTGDLDGLVTPLVHLGQERYVLAAEVDLLRTRLHTRPDPRHPTMWALPRWALEPGAWLAFVLSSLRRTHPEQFPSNPDWMIAIEWAPPGLAAVLEQRDQLRLQWESARAEFEEHLAGADSAVEEQVAQAASGPQRSLTESGEALVDAVVGQLRDMGFVATKMDDHHDAKTGAKLEDLRVTDPTAPGWVCLVEIKGYTAGARVNDVPRIATRPVANYVRETGEYPAAVWHVVNTYRERDPSQRPPTLQSDADLEPLTNADGALIDTRELFKAWRAVATGQAAAEDVRASLRAAITRWDWNPASSS